MIAPSSPALPTSASWPWVSAVAKHGGGVEPPSSLRCFTLLCSGLHEHGLRYICYAVALARDRSYRGRDFVSIEEGEAAITILPHTSSLSDQLAQHRNLVAIPADPSRPPIPPAAAAVVSHDYCLGSSSLWINPTPSSYSTDLCCLRRNQSGSYY